MRNHARTYGFGVALIEPEVAWAEWGFNMPEQAMRERRDTLDALHPEDVPQALLYGFAQPANVLVEELLVCPCVRSVHDGKLHSRVTGQLWYEPAVAASVGAPDGADRLGMAISDKGNMRGAPSLGRSPRAGLSSRGEGVRPAKPV